MKPTIINNNNNTNTDTSGDFERPPVLSPPRSSVSPPPTQRQQSPSAELSLEECLALMRQRAQRIVDGGESGDEYSSPTSAHHRVIVTPTITTAATSSYPIVGSSPTYHRPSPQPSSFTEESASLPTSFQGSNRQTTAMFIPTSSSMMAEVPSPPLTSVDCSQREEDNNDNDNDEGNTSLFDTSIQRKSHEHHQASSKKGNSRSAVDREASGGGSKVGAGGIRITTNSSSLSEATISQTSSGNFGRRRGGGGDSPSSTLSSILMVSRSEPYNRSHTVAAPGAAAPTPTNNHNLSSSIKGGSSSFGGYSDATPAAPPALRRSPPSYPSYPNPPSSLIKTPTSEAADQAAGPGGVGGGGRLHQSSTQRPVSNVSFSLPPADDDVAAGDSSHQHHNGSNSSAYEGHHHQHHQGRSPLYQYTADPATTTTSRSNNNNTSKKTSNRLERSMSSTANNNTTTSPGQQQQPQYRRSSSSAGVPPTLLSNTGRFIHSDNNADYHEFVDSPRGGGRKSSLASNNTNHAQSSTNHRRGSTTTFSSVSPTGSRRRNRRQASPSSPASGGGQQESVWDDDDDNVVSNQQHQGGGGYYMSVKTTRPRPSLLLTAAYASLSAGVVVGILLHVSRRSSSSSSSSLTQATTSASSSSSSGFVLRPLYMLGRYTEKLLRAGIIRALQHSPSFSSISLEQQRTILDISLGAVVCVGATSFKNATSVIVITLMDDAAATAKRRRTSEKHPNNNTTNEADENTSGRHHRTDTSSTTNRDIGATSSFFEHHATTTPASPTTTTTTTTTPTTPSHHHQYHHHGSSSSVAAMTPAAGVSSSSFSMFRGFSLLSALSRRSSLGTSLAGPATAVVSPSSAQTAPKSVISSNGSDHATTAAPTSRTLSHDDDDENYDNHHHRTRSSNKSNYFSNNNSSSSRLVGRQRSVSVGSCASQNNTTNNNNNKQFGGSGSIRYNNNNSLHNSSSSSPPLAPTPIHSNNNTTIASAQSNKPRKQQPQVVGGGGVGGGVRVPRNRSSDLSLNDNNHDSSSHHHSFGDDGGTPLTDGNHNNNFGSNNNSRLPPSAFPDDSTHQWSFKAGSPIRVNNNNNNQITGLALNDDIVSFTEPNDAEFEEGDNKKNHSDENEEMPTSNLQYRDMRRRRQQKQLLSRRASTMHGVGAVSGAGVLMGRSSSMSRTAVRTHTMSGREGGSSSPRGGGGGSVLEYSNNNNTHYPSENASPTYSSAGVLSTNDIRLSAALPPLDKNQPMMREVGSCDSLGHQQNTAGGCGGGSSFHTNNSSVLLRPFSRSRSTTVDLGTSSPPMSGPASGHGSPYMRPRGGSHNNPNRPRFLSTGFCLGGGGGGCDDGGFASGGDSIHEGSSSPVSRRPTTTAASVHSRTSGNRQHRNPSSAAQSVDGTTTTAQQGFIFGQSPPDYFPEEAEEDQHSIQPHHHHHQPTATTGYESPSDTQSPMLLREGTSSGGAIFKTGSSTNTATTDVGGGGMGYVAGGGVRGSSTLGGGGRAASQSGAEEDDTLPYSAPNPPLVTPTSSHHHPSSHHNHHMLRSNTLGALSTENSGSFDQQQLHPQQPSSSSSRIPTDNVTTTAISGNPPATATTSKTRRFSVTNTGKQRRPSGALVAGAHFISGDLFAQQSSSSFSAGSPPRQGGGGGGVVEGGGSENGSSRRMSSTQLGGVPLSPIISGVPTSTIFQKWNRSSPHEQPSHQTQQQQQQTRLRRGSGLGSIGRIQLPRHMTPRLSVFSSSPNSSPSSPFAPQHESASSPAFTAHAPPTCGVPSPTTTSTANSLAQRRRHSHHAGMLNLDAFANFSFDCRRSSNEGTTPTSISPTTSTTPVIAPPSTPSLSGPTPSNSNIPPLSSPSLRTQSMKQLRRKSNILPLFNVNETPPSVHAPPHSALPPIITHELPPSGGGGEYALRNTAEGNDAAARLEELLYGGSHHRHHHNTPDANNNNASPSSPTNPLLLSPPGVDNGGGGAMVLSVSGSLIQSQGSTSNSPKVTSNGSESMSPRGGSATKHHHQHHKQHRRSTEMLQPPLSAVSSGSHQEQHKQPSPTSTTTTTTTAPSFTRRKSVIVAGQLVSENKGVIAALQAAVSQPHLIGGGGGASSKGAAHSNGSPRGSPRGGGGGTTSHRHSGVVTNDSILSSSSPRNKNNITFAVPPAAVGGGGEGATGCAECPSAILDNSSNPNVVDALEGSNCSATNPASAGSTWLVNSPTQSSSPHLSPKQYPSSRRQSRFSSTVTTSLPGSPLNTNNKTTTGDDSADPQGGGGGGGVGLTSTRGSLLLSSNPPQQSVTDLFALADIPSGVGERASRVQALNLRSSNNAAAAFGRTASVRSRVEGAPTGSPYSAREGDTSSTTGSPHHHLHASPHQLRRASVMNIAGGRMGSQVANFWSPLHTAAASPRSSIVRLSTNVDVEGQTSGNFDVGGGGGASPRASICDGAMHYHSPHADSHSPFNSPRSAHLRVPHRSRGHHQRVASNDNIGDADNASASGGYITTTVTGSPLNVTSSSHTATTTTTTDHHTRPSYGSPGRRALVSFEGGRNNNKNNNNNPTDYSPTTTTTSGGLLVGRSTSGMVNREAGSFRFKMSSAAPTPGGGASGGGSTRSLRGGGASGSPKQLCQDHENTNNNNGGDGGGGGALDGGADSSFLAIAAASSSAGSPLLTNFGEIRDATRLWSSSAHHHHTGRSVAVNVVSSPIHTPKGISATTAPSDVDDEHNSSTTHLQNSNRRSKSGSPCLIPTSPPNVGLGLSRSSSQHRLTHASHYHYHHNQPDLLSSTTLIDNTQQHQQPFHATQSSLAMTALNAAAIPTRGGSAAIRRQKSANSGVFGSGSSPLKSPPTAALSSPTGLRSPLRSTTSANILWGSGIGQHQRGVGGGSPRHTDLGSQSPLYGASPVEDTLHFNQEISSASAPNEISGSCHNGMMLGGGSINQALSSSNRTGSNLQGASSQNHSFSSGGVAHTPTNQETALLMKKIPSALKKNGSGRFSPHHAVSLPPHHHQQQIPLHDMIPSNCNSPAADESSLLHSPISHQQNHLPGLPPLSGGIAGGGDANSSSAPSSPSPKGGGVVATSTTGGGGGHSLSSSYNHNNPLMSSLGWQGNSFFTRTAISMSTTPNTSFSQFSSGMRSRGASGTTFGGGAAARSFYQSIYRSQQQAGNGGGGGINSSAATSAVVTPTSPRAPGLLQLEGVQELQLQQVPTGDACGRGPLHAGTSYTTTSTTHNNRTSSSSSRPPLASGGSGGGAVQQSTSLVSRLFSTSVSNASTIMTPLYLPAVNHANRVVSGLTSPVMNPPQQQQQPTPSSMRSYLNVAKSNATVSPPSNSQVDENTCPTAANTMNSTSNNTTTTTAYYLVDLRRLVSISECVQVGYFTVLSASMVVLEALAMTPLLSTTTGGGGDGCGEGEGGGSPVLSQNPSLFRLPSGGFISTTHSGIPPPQSSSSRRLTIPFEDASRMDISAAANLKNIQHRRHHSNNKRSNRNRGSTNSQHNGGSDAGGTLTSPLSDNDDHNGIMLKSFHSLHSSEVPALSLITPKHSRTIDDFAVSDDGKSTSLHSDNATTPKGGNHDNNVEDEFSPSFSPMTGIVSGGMTMMMDSASDVAGRMGSTLRGKMNALKCTLEKAGLKKEDVQKAVSIFAPLSGSMFTNAWSPSASPARETPADNIRSGRSGNNNSVQDHPLLAATIDSHDSPLVVATRTNNNNINNNSSSMLRGSPTRGGVSTIASHQDKCLSPMSTSILLDEGIHSVRGGGGGGGHGDMESVASLFAVGGGATTTTGMWVDNGGVESVPTQVSTLIGAILAIDIRPPVQPISVSDDDDDNTNNNAAKYTPQQTFFKPRGDKLLEESFHRIATAVQSVVQIVRDYGGQVYSAESNRIIAVFTPNATSGASPFSPSPSPPRSRGGRRRGSDDASDFDPLEQTTRSGLGASGQQQGLFGAAAEAAGIGSLDFAKRAVFASLAICDELESLAVEIPSIPIYNTDVVTNEEFIEDYEEGDPVVHFSFGLGVDQGSLGCCHLEPVRSHHHHHHHRQNSSNHVMMKSSCLLMGSPMELAGDLSVLNYHLQTRILLTQAVQDEVQSFVVSLLVDFVQVGTSSAAAPLVNKNTKRSTKNKTTRRRRRTGQEKKRSTDLHSSKNDNDNDDRDADIATGRTNLHNTKRRMKSNIHHNTNMSLAVLRPLQESLFRHDLMRRFLDLDNTTNTTAPETLLLCDHSYWFTYYRDELNTTHLWSKQDSLLHPLPTTTTTTTGMATTSHGDMGGRSTGSTTTTTTQSISNPHTPVETPGHAAHLLSTPTTTPGFGAMDTPLSTPAASTRLSHSHGNLVGVGMQLNTLSLATHQKSKYGEDSQGALSALSPATAVTGLDVSASSQSLSQLPPPASLYASTSNPLLHPLNYYISTNNVQETESGNNVDDNNHRRLARVDAQVLYKKLCDRKKTTTTTTGTTTPTTTTHLLEMTSAEMFGRYTLVAEEARILSSVWRDFINSSDSIVGLLFAISTTTTPTTTSVNNVDNEGDDEGGTDVAGGEASNCNSNSSSNSSSGDSNDGSDSSDSGHSDASSNNNDSGNEEEAQEKRRAPVDLDVTSIFELRGDLEELQLCRELRADERADMRREQRCQEKVQDLILNGYVPLQSGDDVFTQLVELGKVTITLQSAPPASRRRQKRPPTSSSTDLDGVPWEDDDNNDEEDGDEDEEKTIIVTAGDSDSEDEDDEEDDGGVPGFYLPDAVMIHYLEAFFLFRRGLYRKAAKHLSANIPSEYLHNDVQINRLGRLMTFYASHPEIAKAKQEAAGGAYFRWRFYDPWENPEDWYASWIDTRHNRAHELKIEKLRQKEKRDQRRQRQEARESRELVAQQHLVSETVKALLERQLQDNQKQQSEMFNTLLQMGVGVINNTGTTTTRGMSDSTVTPPPPKLFVSSSQLSISSPTAPAPPSSPPPLPPPTTIASDHATTTTHHNIQNHQHHKFADVPLSPDVSQPTPLDTSMNNLSLMRSGEEREYDEHRLDHHDDADDDDDYDDRMVVGRPTAAPRPSSIHRHEDGETLADDEGGAIKINTPLLSQKKGKKRVVLVKPLHASLGGGSSRLDTTLNSLISTTTATTTTMAVPSPIHPSLFRATKSAADLFSLLVSQRDASENRGRSSAKRMEPASSNDDDDDDDLDSSFKPLPPTATTVSCSHSPTWSTKHETNFSYQTTTTINDANTATTCGSLSPKKKSGDAHQQHLLLRPHQHSHQQQVHGASEPPHHHTSTSHNATIVNSHGQLLPATSSSSAATRRRRRGSAPSRLSPPSFLTSLWSGTTLAEEQQMIMYCEDDGEEDTPPPLKQVQSAGTSPKYLSPPNHNHHHHGGGGGSSHMGSSVASHRTCSTLSHDGACMLEDAGLQQTFLGIPMNDGSGAFVTLVGGGSMGGGSPGPMMSFYSPDGENSHHNANNHDNNNNSYERSPSQLLDVPQDNNNLSSTSQVAAERCESVDSQHHHTIAGRGTIEFNVNNDVNTTLTPHNNNNNNNNTSSGSCNDVQHHQHQQPYFMRPPPSSLAFGNMEVSTTHFEEGVESSTSSMLHHDTPPIAVLLPSMSKAGLEGSSSDTTVIVDNSSCNNSHHNTHGAAEAGLSSGGGSVGAGLPHNSFSVINTTNSPASASRGGINQRPTQLSMPISPSPAGSAFESVGGGGGGSVERPPIPADSSMSSSSMLAGTWNQVGSPGFLQRGGGTSFTQNNNTSNSRALSATPSFVNNNNITNGGRYRPSVSPLQLTPPLAPNHHQQNIDVPSNILNIADSHNGGDISSSKMRRIPTPLSGVFTFEREDSATVGSGEDQQLQFPPATPLTRQQTSFIFQVSNDANKGSFRFQHEGSPAPQRQALDNYAAATSSHNNAVDEENNNNNSGDATSPNLALNGTVLVGAWRHANAAPNHNHAPSSSVGRSRLAGGGTSFSREPSGTTGGGGGGDNGGSGPSPIPPTSFDELHEMRDGSAAAAANANGTPSTSTVGGVSSPPYLLQDPSSGSVPFPQTPTMATHIPFTPLRQGSTSTRANRASMARQHGRLGSTWASGGAGGGAIPPNTPLMSGSQQQQHSVSPGSTSTAFVGGGVSGSMAGLSPSTGGGLDRTSVSRRGGGGGAGLKESSPQMIIDAIRASSMATALAAKAQAEADLLTKLQQQQQQQLDSEMLAAGSTTPLHTLGVVPGVSFVSPTPTSSHQSDFHRVNSEGEANDTNDNNNHLSPQPRNPNYNINSSSEHDGGGGGMMSEGVALFQRDTSESPIPTLSVGGGDDNNNSSAPRMPRNDTMPNLLNVPDGLPSNATSRTASGTSQQQQLQLQGHIATENNNKNHDGTVVPTIITPSLAPTAHSPTPPTTAPSVFVNPADVWCDHGTLNFKDVYCQSWRRSEKVLGVGAFGQVYLGMRPSDGKLVAMKQLKIPEVSLEGDDDEDSAKKEAEELAGLSPADRRRRLMMNRRNAGNRKERQQKKQREDLGKLVSEVQLLCRLKHANIVQFAGCGIVGMNILINLEYVSGGSLQTIVSEFGALPVPAVQRYLKDTLRGLQYLHRVRIIHCDVKPGNVLLTVEGHCKVTDFGTSLSTKSLMETDGSGGGGGSSSNIAGGGGGGGALGTPLYMAPEAARGAAHVTYASDVYSIGIMTYEMLTGKTPWTITDEISMHRHMYRLSHDAEYGPEIDRDQLPTDQSYNFITQCTQREPSKRPTVDELLMHAFLFSVGGGGSSSSKTGGGDASESRTNRKSVSQRAARK